MGTIRERFARGEYLALPKIERSTIRWKWADSWYDGPINGCAELAARMYWFDLVSEVAGPRGGYLYRDYVLVDLAEDQLTEIKRRHNAFRELVGSHLDYDADERLRGSAALQPTDSWQDFYEKAAQWPELDLSRNAVVGWFEDVIGPASEKNEEEPM